MTGALEFRSRHSHRFLFLPASTLSRCLAHPDGDDDAHAAREGRQRMDRDAFQRR